MTRVKQAVILAGGYGTRLLPLTETQPKPMIRFYGRPFLSYLIDILKKNGITDILLLVGYLHETIREYFGDGSKFGISISYSYDPPDTDTGSRIFHAVDHIDTHFLLLYGDNIWPLQLDRVMHAYKKSGSPALVTVYRNTDNATKNNVYVNDDGMVETYDRTRKKTKLNGVDIGFFLLDKQVFTPAPRGNVSFENVILSNLVRQKKLSAFVTDHKYYGLSNLKRIPMIEQYLLPKKVIFLDRDGVLNKKPKKASYVTHPDDMQLLPRVSAALKLLKKKEYEIYIITNQPGVGRGVMTESQLNAVHKRLLDDIRDAGVTIQGVYACLHGWHDGCNCRKPMPGLFFRAAHEHYIDLTESICIGDDARDIMAGKRAACKTIYIGNKLIDSFPPGERPDKVYASLYDAVTHL